jgi:4'-phosphopantetheinyl transferase
MSVELSDFTQAALLAFARGGVVAPTAGEACVLISDCTVWTAHTISAEELLDAGERKRAARFRFEHDRAAYVLAHALWRMALGVCLGVDAARVPLESTPAGQPRLPGTAFATSLSHSGPWVAIAITTGATVGVDIERSPPRMPLDELMPAICTPAEMTDMQQLPASACETALLTLWTRKEALLKAFGIGLIEAPALLPAMTDGWIMPPAAAPTQIPCRVLGMGLPAKLVGALAVPAAVATARVNWLDNAPGR